MIISTPQQSVPLHTTDNGAVLIAGTRVPLDTVVYAYRDGAAPDEIVASFTSLDLADVYSVIAYVLKHESEVNEYLRQREVEAEAVRREIEEKFPSDGLRERLLARRRAQGE